MVTLNAKALTLTQVQTLLGLEKQPGCDFSALLAIEALTAFEGQELGQIWQDFEHYWLNGKVLEGQVKLLVMAPLLRLAGFYRPPIQITLEQNVVDLWVEEEDTQSTGRCDLLAVSREHQTVAGNFFWILVIEAKNSSINPWEGLPQLLTYADTGLRTQTAVWGLVTNGMQFQFVYLHRGESSPTYQLMPLLNLADPRSATTLLQVLKAIAQSYPQPR